MLYQKIQEDIKEAMKSKNKDKRDTLKQVQIKAQATAKENKVEITDEIVVDAINKELKQLNQTKTALAGKEDSSLYVSTEGKISILKGYLPEQLSEEDCMVEVQKVLSGLADDMPKGAKIGSVMKALKGKADNALIKKCVDRCLM